LICKNTTFSLDVTVVASGLVTAVRIPGDPTNILLASGYCGSDNKWPINSTYGLALENSITNTITNSCPGNQGYFGIAFNGTSLIITTITAPSFGYGSCV